MRILVVTQYFWPENFKINDVVADLSELGHQITVLTGIPNYPRGTVYESYKQAPNEFNSYSGAEIIRVPITPRGKTSLSLIINYVTYALSACFFGTLRLRKRNFDVIFVYEPSPITVGLPAIVLGSAKKVPIVFWVQDLWPESLQAIGVIKNRYLLALVGRLVAFIYNRCDLILAQSKSFIPKIKKYSNTFTPIVYFPNWAERIFEDPDDRLAPEIPIKKCSFDIIFAGNIGEAQDFPSILAAAERLKLQTHIRWIILGDGRLFEWVVDQVERRGLRDCFLMLGRFPPNRMPSFFNHASALLVSLKNEPIFSMTIPSKLQSYLASGVPLITMLNGEGAAIVEASKAGFSCPPGDFNALADLVLKLSNMTDGDRERMGANGVEYSKMEFQRAGLMLRLEQMLIQLQRDNSSFGGSGS